MLDSMIRNPRPTRAEVTDVANAVYDGTDAVMLSGETAQGKYPVEALQMMVEIVKNTESHLDYDSLLDKAQENRKKNISCAIGYSSVATAASLNAKCIITPTASGATARVVSKFRPKAAIIGVSPNEETLRRMQIYRGVYPIKSLPYNSTEEVCEEAINLVSAKGHVETGDIVVVTAGIPSTRNKNTRDGMSNMMRIAIVD
jgi:pyruvate kinase